MAECIKCQKSEVDRHGRQAKIVPKLTGECAFEEIAMCVVGDLLDSQGFYTILVVADRFNKVQHYVAEKTTWTVEDFVDSYIKNI